LLKLDSRNIKKNTHVCIKDSGSDRRGKEGGEEGGVKGGIFGKGYFERKPTPIKGKRKTHSRAIIQSRWEGRTEEENGIGGGVLRDPEKQIRDNCEKYTRALIRARTRMHEKQVPSV